MSTLARLRPLCGSLQVHQQGIIITIIDFSNSDFRPTAAGAITTQ